MRKLPKASDQEVVARAMRAYFIAARKELVELGVEGSICQPSNTSGVHEFGGKEYVVLHSGYTIYAVYRVRNDGVLKHLVRWPEGLEKLL
jgi:hypothetical protein